MPTVLFGMCAFSFILVSLVPAPDAGSTSLLPPRSVAQATAAADLPGNVRDALGDRWSGWTLVSPAIPPACADDEQETGAVVTGDFNGDGRADFAVRLTSKGTPHLAVVLSQLVNPTVYELELPANGIDQPLRLHKRGTKYRVAGMSLPSYLGADTLGSDACGATGDLWLWSGSGFVKRPLAG